MLRSFIALYIWAHGRRKALSCEFTLYIGVSMTLWDMSSCIIKICSILYSKPISGAYLGLCKVQDYVIKQCWCSWFCCLSLVLIYTEILGFAFAVVLAECVWAYAVISSEKIGLICLPCFQDFVLITVLLLAIPLFPPTGNCRMYDSTASLHK